MALGGWFPGAFNQALDTGSAPQATGVAGQRLRAQEAKRQRRLRQEDASNEVSARRAQARLDSVSKTSLEAARDRAEWARKSPPMTVEPSSQQGLWGADAVGPTNAREAAFEVSGNYVNQLRGAVDWNKVVNDYKLPLPMKVVDPSVTSQYRDAILPPKYPAFQEDLRTTPEKAYGRYVMNPPGHAPGVYDQFGMPVEAGLSSLIHSKRYAFNTPNGPVFLGADNPFSLTPSPYSPKEFFNEVGRRLQATPRRPQR